MAGHDSDLLRWTSEQLAQRRGFYASYDSYLEVRGSPRELKSIRERLVKILKTCTDSRDEPSRAAPGYRLTIAYFPLATEKRPT